MLYENKENIQDKEEIENSTSTDATYDAFYRALNDFYSEHTELRYDTKSVSTSEVKTVSNYDSDLIEFATSTDCNLYTVQTVNGPETVAQQVGAFTLDIRNILLLFLLIYLIINIYSKLKNTLIKFFND